MKSLREWVRRQPMRFIVGGVVVLLALGLGQWWINRSSDAERVAVDARLETAEASMRSLLEARRQEKNYLLRVGDEVKAAEALAKWSSALDALEKDLAGLGLKVEAEGAYRETFRALSGRRASFNEYEEKLVPPARAAQAAIEDFKRAETAARDAATARATSILNGFAALQVVVGVLVVALIALAGSLLLENKLAAEAAAEQSRHLMDSANEKAMEMAITLSMYFEVLNKVAAGDLEVRAVADSQDELMAQMAVVINSMIDNLKQNKRQVESFTAELKEESERLKTRVDDVLGVLDAVAQGQYDVAAKKTGTGDELDRLAEGTNHCVEKIRETAAAVARAREESDNLSMDMAINLSLCFEALSKLAAGDLASRANVESSNELIVQLAEVINSTAAKLRQSQDELTTKNAQIEEEARNLVTRVAEMREVMQALAAGDFTRKAAVAGRDELTELARSFNESIARLNSLISQVVNSTVSIASAAQEVLAASAQFDKNLKEEANQLNETSAAMTELSASVKEMEKNANQVATQSHKSLTAAEEGGQTVEAVIQRFGGIRSGIENSSRQVLELGKKGKDIGKIVEVITQIAEQTSLLALNAAIEAARAGEQGKGFAVVADEVSKLADRVARSAKEIEELIDTMQSVTDAAVEGIQKGVEDMRQGTAMLDETGGALQTIIKATGETDQLIAEIVTAVHQMASVSNNIATAIASIFNISKEGVQASNELLQEGNSLMTVATGLQKMVSEFKIQS